MNTLTATYRIVTPMFLGDANQNATDIRPPSIKGALRFWWRAMMWGHLLEEAEGDEPLALRCLHRREAELFGSAADEKNGGGQGKFLLKVVKNIKEKNANNRTEQKIVALGKAELYQKYPLQGIGNKYLLGQGLNIYNKEKKHNEYTRTALDVNIDFDVEIIFHSQEDKQKLSEYKEQIAKSLLLLGMLGGLGSRSRRGLGSIAIHKLEGIEKYTAPENEIVFKKQISNLLPNLINMSYPPFTAFSKFTRVDLSCKNNDMWALLNDVGKKMNEYRSFRTNSPQFKPDHDEMIKVANLGNTISGHPERIVFGLPHNYFFSSSSNGAEINIVHKDSKGVWTSEERNRRASPLFIHIHQFPNGSEFLAIQSLIPSKFLPSDHKLQFVQVRSKHRTITNPTSPNPVVINSAHWQKIIDYMNLFQNKQIIL